MSADTFTSTLGTLVMQTGNDNNTWGTLANSSVFQILEDAIANVLTITNTGGTLDLSGSPPPAAASQVRYYSLKFTGALTANQTLIVPNLTKLWMIENLTTGAFSLFVKTTSGTATQIPQGTLKFVRCDGGNGMRRLDYFEIGRAEDFYTPSVPSGFLECDGSAISRTGFPDLYAIIGTLWGAGDGFTTFNLPNTKDTGRFKRSRTGSVVVGVYQSNQNLSHNHALTGTTTDTEGASHTHSGTTGTDTPDHSHNLSINPNEALIGGGATTYNTSGGGGINTGGASARHAHPFTSGTESASHTHTMSSLAVSNSGGAEARPEAVVVISCIRY